jgi:peptidyl-prolyl cis-trans isomerase C
MTKFISIFSFIFILNLLIKIHLYADEKEISKNQDPVVATVNSINITMSDLNMEIQRLISGNPELQNKEDMETMRKVRQEAMDNLINQELLFQEGKKTNLQPKDAEVNARLSNIKQRFPSQELFEQALNQQGMTEKELIQALSRVMTMQKLIDEKIKPVAEAVTDEEVKAFYEENKKGFKEPEKVKARHVLIKLSSDASEEEKKYAKNEMEEILKKARGGDDFAQLAKDNSQCPSAPNGGDLGYFTRGQMVKPFEDAAFALEPGQISDVVETRFGYHIILVEDKKPVRQIELDEVADQIKEGLREGKIDDAIEKWLKPVREKSDIKILFK